MTQIQCHETITSILYNGSVLVLYLECSETDDENEDGKEKHDHNSQEQGNNGNK